MDALAEITCAVLEFARRHSQALAGLFSLSTLIAAARFMFNRFVRSTSVMILGHFSRTLNHVDIYEARNRRTVPRHSCSGADCVRKRLGERAIIGWLRDFVMPAAFMLLQREDKVVFHAGKYYLKGEETPGAR